MTTKKISPLQERRNTLPAAPEGADETRTLRAALSSETPVARYFGTEILEHTEDAIDFSRADDGLPLLVNHDDMALPIGRVRNVQLETDGILRGDLVFSDGTASARDAWSLVRDGSLTDVSIRYRINDYQTRGKGDSEEYRVTSWTPLEASVVSVPADPAVGIGRSHDEGTTMPETTTEAPAAVPEQTTTILGPTASRNAGRQEGARAERERIAEIQSIARQFPANAGVQDTAQTAIAEGHSAEEFRSACLGLLAGEPAEPLAAPAPVPEHISRSAFGGATSNEKLRAAVTEACDIAAGNIEGREAGELSRQNEYVGLSLVEMARHCLAADGHDVRGMGAMDVAGAVLGRYIDPGTANLDTTNFPAILEDVINKALFRGFDEAPVTWNLWCGTDSAPDFKAGTRPGLSNFTSLEVVAENAAIADGIVNDKKEAFQVQTYARKFSITRQTLVNDDLAALAGIAGRMGQAAGRTVDEQVYAFLEANANMTEDSNPLFDATPTTGRDTAGNLISGAGDPSTDNVGQARVKMGKMVDTNNIVLGIVPQFMVCPIELEQKMLEISTLNADPQRVRRDNVYAQMWQPVATPRLTDANDWYMFGNRGDHVNVVFLNGAQAPMMARDEGWSTLAAHWRVVLDFDVMAIDWRSALKFENA